MDLTELARIRDYASLHQAMRRRVDQLRITRETLDAAAKLNSGYASKLLAPVPIKALGRTTMGPVLEALGVELILVERQDFKSGEGDSLVKRLRDRQMLTPREHSVVNLPEARALQRKALHDVLREHGRKFGRKANAARNEKLKPAKRRRIARKAANARWHPPKRVPVVKVVEP